MSGFLYWTCGKVILQQRKQHLRICKIAKFISSLLFLEKKKVTLTQGFFPKVRKNMTDAFDYLIAEERLIVE